MNTVTAYELVLFAHILAASWLAFEHRVTRWNPIAALIVLASGIHLGAWIGWSSGWLQMSVVAFVANSVIAAALVPRLHRRLSASLAGQPDAPVSGAADQQRWSAAWRLAGAAMLANDVALLYLMVRKPDLLGSLAAVAAINAVAAVVAATRRRPSSPPEHASPALA